MNTSLLHRLAQLGLVLSAGLSSLAHAGLVSYSDSVSSIGRDADTRSRLSYQRFDADLGVLREVRFSFDMSTSHTMVFSNETHEERRYAIRYFSSVEFDTPGWWWEGNEKYERQTVAANTDQSSIERNWNAQRSFSITENLARFIGDTPGWMDYRLFHGADGLHDEGSPWGFGSMSTTRVNLRLDYLYDESSSPTQPLPEPTTPALAVLALLACLAPRLKRRGTTARA